MDSIWVIHEFMNVFSMDLSSMCLGCDIDFSIDVESDT